MGERFPTMDEFSTALQQIIESEAAAMGRGEITHGPLYQSLCCDARNRPWAAYHRLKEYDTYCDVDDSLKRRLDLGERDWT